MFTLFILVFLAPNLVSPALGATPGDTLTVVNQAKALGTHNVDVLPDVRALTFIPLNLWDYSPVSCGDRTVIHVETIGLDPNSVTNNQLALGTVLVTDGKESAFGLFDNNADGIVDNAIVRGYTLPDPRLTPQVIFDTIIHCIAFPTVR